MLVHLFDVQKRKFERCKVIVDYQVLAGETVQIIHDKQEILQDWIASTALRPGAETTKTSLDHKQLIIAYGDHLQIILHLTC